MSDDQAIKSRVLNKPLPSADYLRECLMYDPETGVLTWKERPREHFTIERAWIHFNKKYVGSVAGWVGDKKGYHRVTIDHCDYKASRLIWKFVTGEDPLNSIDHKDRDCTNNSWANLRSATNTEQSHNRVRNYQKSGHQGVAAHGKKWRALVTFNGIAWSSNYFDTTEEASAAYEALTSKLHGEFYRQPQTQ